MKLSVRNFKGLEKIDVELHNGLTLVKGPSGTGKSTLIESLLYAFTGKPSRCKPLGTNKKTEVTATFKYKNEDINIVRSTRPGRLVVRVAQHMDIEDAEAQSFINSIIGEKFDIVSYIPQNTTKSFMCMSPAVKLEFLEHIALDGKAGQWKEAAKKNVKECKLALAKAESALEVHTKMYSDVKCSSNTKQRAFDKTKYPSDNEKLKEYVDNYELNKRDAKDQLRLIRVETKQIEDELHQLKVREALKTEKEKRLKKKTWRIQKLDDQLKESPCENIAELRQMEKETKGLLDEIRQIETLEASFPRWYDPKKDMEKENAQWFEKQECKKDELKNCIEAAKLQHSVFFACPSCDTNLCFDKVTEETTITKKTAPTLFCRKSVKDLMREDAQVDSRIRERKISIQGIEKTKQKIQNVKDEWAEEVEREELEESLDVIRDFISIMKRKKKIEAEIDSLENEKEECAPSDVNRQQLENDLENLRMDREREEQKYEEANKTIQDVYEWKNKLDQFSRIKLLELSVEKATAAMNKKIEEFKGAEELKTAVSEAYGLSLLTIVNQINDNAAVYLDEFFREDPIEVSLKTFSCTKTNKKVKPSLKCEILYKSNEMTLENLSGGERARVVIAFNLALCDILDSSFVMLDEVTANLDSELTEQIFETVKSSMGGKVIVAVAHQCVDGVFDKVINF